MRTEACTENRTENRRIEPSRARARLPYGEEPKFGASVHSSMHRTEAAAALTLAALQCGAHGQDADPAAAYPTAKSRRAAWAAWEAAGAPWPPPAGLVSAALDQCRGDGRGKWR